MIRLRTPVEQMLTAWTNKMIEMLENTILPSTQQRHFLLMRKMIMIRRFSLYDRRVRWRVVSRGGVDQYRMSSSTARHAARNVTSSYTDRAERCLCRCRYLTQLEMQLQLRCEDVEADIESTAHHLAQQMPSMLQAADQIQVLSIRDVARCDVC